MKNRRVFIIFSWVVVLFLLSAPAYGQGEANKASLPPVWAQTNGQNAPIEQPLVPEGVFAIQLVEALKIGQAQDEAEAESILGGKGIEPKNGWIGGYPVTPVIIGEIRKGVVAAADSHELKMGRDEALKAVENLEAKFGLSIVPDSPPQPGGQSVPYASPTHTVIYKYVDKNGVIYYTDQYESIPKEYRNQIEVFRETVESRPYAADGAGRNETQSETYDANPEPQVDSPHYDPEVVDTHYDNDGPPVVTYYPPPASYDYLYSWVPYPFWSSGFYFSGFFILNDFHKHTFIHKPPYVVTNHVAQASSKRTFVVDPRSRALRQSVMSSQVTSPPAYTSPGGQSGARRILESVQNRTAAANAPSAQKGVSPITPPAGKRTPAQTLPGQHVNPPPMAGPPVNNPAVNRSNPSATGSLGTQQSNGRHGFQLRIESAPQRASERRTFGSQVGQGKTVISPPPPVFRTPSVSPGQMAHTPQAGSHSSLRAFSGRSGAVGRH